MGSRTKGPLEESGVDRRSFLGDEADAAFGLLVAEARAVALVHGSELGVL